MWAILEEKTCTHQHTSVVALKASLDRPWRIIPQETLRDSVEVYPERLKAMINAKEGILNKICCITFVRYQSNALRKILKAFLFVLD